MRNMEGNEMVKDCTNCGTELNGEEEVRSKCGQQVAANKKKKRKWIWVLLVGVACCSILIIGGVWIGMRLLKNEPNIADAGSGAEYISFMEGFTDVKIEDKHDAIEAVDSVSAILGIEDIQKELKVTDVNQVGNDDYYRMQQYYKGVPVYGSTVVVCADGEGKATALTSNFLPVTEKISLKPEVAFEELGKIIVKYLKSVEAKEYSILGDGLVIYRKQSGEHVLAYSVITGNKNLIIDANTTELCATIDTFHNEAWECEYKDGKFEGIKISDNSFQLGNEEDNIFIFNANRSMALDKERNLHPNRVAPMMSEDNYFGNMGDDFSSKDYSKAVYLLGKLREIAGFYKNINSSQNTATIATINNGYDAYNAYGGYHDVQDITTYELPSYQNKVISIVLGYKLCDNLKNGLDTIGHEYTHGVSHSHGAFLSSYNQSLALDEAYADIFGELIEAKLTGRELNWINGQRNMKNPHEYENMVYPYPTTITELNNAKTTEWENETWYCTTSDTQVTDYAHFASTIISHTAYLMWNGIDGNEDMKLDSETLANLWYRSLMLMQPDANFSQCRNAVELSARIMLKNEELTENQSQCVVEAFKMSGIERTTYTYDETVQNQFTLSVLSRKESENIKFDMSIYEMDLIGLETGNMDCAEKIYEKTQIKGDLKLELKDGIYAIYIKDAESFDDSTTIKIKVVVKGGESESVDKLVVYTDFSDITTIILNDEMKMKESIEESLKIYAPIIEQYKEAIQHDFYVGTRDEYGEYVNSTLVYASAYCGEIRVFYALKDINDDGVNEFVIGSKLDGGNIGICDIFTHDGSNPVPLFYVGTFGERTKCELYDTGVIYVAGSGGAELHSFDYYKLPTGSTAVEHIEGFSVENDIYYRVNEAYERIATITESEFNTVRTQYESDEMELSWKEITRDTGEDVGYNQGIEKNNALEISAELISKYETYYNMNIACELDYAYEFTQEELEGVWGALTDEQQELLSCSYKCLCCKSYEEAKAHTEQYIDSSLLIRMSKDYIVYEGNLYFFMGNKGAVSFHNIQLKNYTNDEITATADLYGSGNNYCETYLFTIEYVGDNYKITAVEVV